MFLLLLIIKEIDMNVKENPTEVVNNLHCLIEKFIREARNLSNNNEVSVEIEDFKSGLINQPMPEYNWAWESDNKPLEYSELKGVVKVPGMIELKLRIKYSPNIS